MPSIGKSRRCGRCSARSRECFPSLWREAASARRCEVSFGLPTIFTPRAFSRPYDAVVSVSPRKRHPAFFPVIAASFRRKVSLSAMSLVSAERQLFRLDANAEKRPLANISRTPDSVRRRARAHQRDKVITNQVNLVCKDFHHEPPNRRLNRRSVSWPGVHRRMRRSQC
jgi:hypothetical protein